MHLMNMYLLQVKNIKDREKQWEAYMQSYAYILMYT